MNLALETKAIAKLYGTTEAVVDLDWQLPVGSACAFLGPNGSGKTTTLGYDTRNTWDMPTSW